MATNPNVAPPSERGEKSRLNVDRLRRSPLVLLASAAILMLAVTLALMSFRGQVADAYRARTLVAQVDSGVQTLDAVEWRVIAAGGMRAEERAKLEAAERRAQPALAQLSRPGAAPREIGSLRAAYRTYATALHREFRAFASGNQQQARLIDVIQVDPSFERLDTALGAASARLDRWARDRVALADWGMLLALVGGLLSLATLIWRHDRVQRRAALALAEGKSARLAEHRFRTFVSNLPGAVYRRAFDSDWTVEFVTDAIEEMTGHEARDFVQNRVRAFAGLIDPAYREELEHEIRLAAEQGAPYSLAYRILHADGRPRWVVDRGHATRGDDGAIVCLEGTISDITELREAEQERTRLTEYVRQLVDSSPNGIYGLDVEGRCIFINDAGATLLGYAPEETLGHNMHDLVHHSHPDGSPYPIADCPLFRAFRTGECCQLESDVLWHRNGTPIPVWMSSAPVMEDGGIVGAVVTFADISERKALEAERDRMEIERRLAQKLEAVGQLSAGIAHEINTPVQFVSDSVSFLRESFADLEGLVAAQHDLCRTAGGPGGAALLGRLEQAQMDADLAYIQERVPAAFERIAEGLGRVSSIVHAMRDFVRADGLEKAPADINQALDTTLVVACNTYKYVADVVTEFAELPPVVCSVSDLNQAFLNLIVNAAHAVEEASAGGRRGTIGVRTRREGAEVVIEISDTGGGIPAAIRDRVFDPFFTTRDVGSGRGQGLAQTRAIIVDRHHGSISFTSEPGHGTTFAVRLPIDGSEQRGSVLAA